MAEPEVVRQESARFTTVNGDLVVLGGYIDALARAALLEAGRPKFANVRISTSIKIASEDELRESKSERVVCLNTPLSEDLRTIVTLDVRSLQGNESYSIALVWKAGDQIRRHMGMPLKTLFIDVCHEEKQGEITYNTGSMLTPRRLSPEQIPVLIEYCRISAQHSNHQPSPPGQWVAIADHLIRAEKTDPEVLDLLTVMMHKTRNFEMGFEVSRNLISNFPNDPRGYFRAAAYYSHVAKSSSSAPPYAWKLAMMLYGEALKHALNLQDQAGSAGGNQEKSHFEEKLIAQALQAILYCARHTEFDGIATEREIADLPKEYWKLMPPWSPQVRKEVLRAFFDRGEPDPSTLLSMDSRERMCVYTIDGENAELVVVRKLPRFFRWITPFRMAVMSTPRSAPDIQVLALLGIHHVVTLTKEEPLPEKWFNSQQHLHINNVFMPVSNYKAPTIAQVDNFFTLFDSTADKTGEETPTATLVHCGGGKGRAGTFIACYLARYGFTATPDELPRYSSPEVIDIVRKMRPGSIETVEQENFISKFVKELWKRAQTGGKEVLLPEPNPGLELVASNDLRLQVEGELNPSKLKLIVCCGIPGCGKSSFSEALARRAGWMVACQDECGSRDACAGIVSSAMRQGRPVIVDRCNPTMRDRQEWIDMAVLPKSQTLCVFFDYEEGLCLQRANRRVDHPTLEAGRARNAVHSMQKSLQRPGIDEKFGGIVTIRSIAEANKLVECLVGQNSKVCASLQQNLRATTTASSSSVFPQQVSKAGGFHKFPRTRHLMNFGSATRDDLIMTRDEAAAFLQSDGGVIVTFQEKVDGANMGFSIDPDTGQVRAQNRSHYVTSKSHPQFKKLDLWISNHLQGLMTVLNPRDGGEDEDHTTPAADAGRYILFGEWLQATHSIRYTHLPDYFLAFDIYDAAEDKFWSRERLENTLKATSIHSVPRIATPNITEDVFQHLMNRKSHFYDGPIEGVYVRRDVGPFLLDRAKVVRKDFISGNTHWSKQISTENTIRWHS